jgi:hypothetical protein
MRHYTLIENFLSCSSNGQCKSEKCELWDQYSHTCTLKAILLELREQTAELKLRRRYLKRKTVEELEDEDIFCDEDVFKKRNSKLLEKTYI